MKHAWFGLSILFISIILMTCKKEDGDIPTELYTCIITLDNELKIQKVENYFSDSLENSIIYNYQNYLVEVIKTVPSLNIQSVSSYFINNTGLADSCITIEYKNNNLTKFFISKYCYNDKYKIETEIRIDDYDSGMMTSTSYADLIYTIKDSNTVAMWINGTCSEYFEFNKTENKIDIERFSGDYNGKINKNLLESSYTDCPTSDHSEFEYNIDANGFVIERVEHSYSGYGSEKNETRKITQFEYKFQ
jgi:hypothetical protein